MQFDIASFAIGTVVGIVLAFIMRLRVLKKLDFKLEQIGINLGIEGFDKNDDPSVGIKLDNISGKVGDIAGRDLHKKVNQNSNFYKNVQAAAQDALRTVLRDRETRPSENKSTLSAERRTRLTLKPQSGELVSRLGKLDRGDNWFERFVTEWFSSSDFDEQIKKKIEDLISEGWQPQTIRPSDNLSDNGLLIEIVSSKPIR